MIFYYNTKALINTNIHITDYYKQATKRPFITIFNTNHIIRYGFLFYFPISPTDRPDFRTSIKVTDFPSTESKTGSNFFLIFQENTSRKPAIKYDRKYKKQTPENIWPRHS